jgi:phosphonate transport system permease protein
MRSIGFIAKITAEAIENVDPKPIEAIKAVGGTKLQVLRFGIMPQVLPVVLGTIIFEWDINIRRSAIMGLVGAGGLGLTFHRQMVMFNWPGVTTVILAILVLIVIGEVFSHYVRKAVT